MKHKELGVHFLSILGLTIGNVTLFQQRRIISLGHILINITYLGKTSKKRNCIFYDMWQKGPLTKTKFQKINLNLDKFLQWVGEKI